MFSHKESITWMPEKVQARLKRDIDLSLELDAKDRQKILHVMGLCKTENLNMVELVNVGSIDLDYSPKSEEDDLFSDIELDQITLWVRENAFAVRVDTEYGAFLSGSISKEAII